MVGAGITSVQSYGWDTMGLACSMLEQARRAAAYAGSPEGGGKCIDLILALLDGASGSADPAFAAHTGPIQFWATAWWQRWFDPAQLQQAFAGATAKLQSAKGSCWNSVAGPTAGSACVHGGCAQHVP